MRDDIAIDDAINIVNAHIGDREWADLIVHDILHIGIEIKYPEKINAEPTRSDGQEGLPSAAIHQHPGIAAATANGEIHVEPGRWPLSEVQFVRQTDPNIYSDDQDHYTVAGEPAVLPPDRRP